MLPAAGCPGPRPSLTARSHFVPPGAGRPRPAAERPSRTCGAQFLSALRGAYRREYSALRRPSFRAARYPALHRRGLWVTPAETCALPRSSPYRASGRHRLGRVRPRWLANPQGSTRGHISSNGMCRNRSAGSILIGLPRFQTPPTPTPHHAKPNPPGRRAYEILRRQQSARPPLRPPADGA